MSTTQENLSEYVQRIMRENALTALEVKRVSQRRGGEISRANVQAILQGKTPNPGIITLRDLAWGLSRPVEEVLAHALGLPPTENAAFLKSELANIWELSKHLPIAEQRFFKRLLQMIEHDLRRVLGSD